MTGLLVDNLGSNQLAFELLTHLNKSNCEAGVFYKNNVPPCLPVHCFSASLEDAIHCSEYIATNLELAYYMLDLGPKSRSLLLWDLEWMRCHNYNLTSRIYNDKSIRLLARSQSHKRAIESAWNREVYLFKWEDL